MLDFLSNLFLQYIS